MPYLGDLTAITLADEHARPRQTELAWSDGIRPALQPVLPAPHELHERLAEGIHRVLHPPSWNTRPICRRERPYRAGARQPPVASTQGADASRSGNNGPPQPNFDLQSLVLLPLLARGRALGVLSLAMGHSGRRYNSSEPALAEDLAGRAAIALDNARLYRNVQEADRHKDEFLSMLAHELRNPLAPIRNAVQLLRLRGSDETRRCRAARNDRPSSAAAHPPGGRSARSVAHHARQDPLADWSTSTWPGSLPAPSRRAGRSSTPASTN